MPLTFYFAIFGIQKIKVETSLVKGVKRQRETSAPDTDEPERKTMKRPKTQVSGS